MSVIPYGLNDIWKLPFSLYVITIIHYSLSIVHCFYRGYFVALPRNTSRFAAAICVANTHPPMFMMHNTFIKIAFLLEGDLGETFSFVPKEKFSPSIPQKNNYLGGPPMPGGPKPRPPSSGTSPISLVSPLTRRRLPSTGDVNIVVTTRSPSSMPSVT